MIDPKAYKKCREDLLYDLLGAVGLVGSLLPAEVRPGSKLARLGGSQWNNIDLKSVADKLQDVLYRFDALQYSLGLWEHPARFGHEPPGSTNPPPEEKPPVSKPKKSTSKPKPSTKGDPRKQPPKNPRGGSGYSDNHHGR